MDCQSTSQKTENNNFHHKDCMTTLKEYIQAENSVDHTSANLMRCSKGSVKQRTHLKQLFLTDILWQVCAERLDSNLLTSFLLAPDIRLRIPSVSNKDYCKSWSLQYQ